MGRIPPRTSERFKLLRKRPRTASTPFVDCLSQVKASSLWSIFGSRLLSRYTADLTQFILTIENYAYARCPQAGRYVPAPEQAANGVGGDLGYYPK
jgi:hypothetical protein